MLTGLLTLHIAGKMKQIMWMVTDDGKQELPYASKNFTVDFIRTKRKQTIATMNIRYPGVKTTILFSHGNATDIGCMRDHLIDIALQLRVNITCYDYSGYGLSSGKASIKNVLADVEAVFAFLFDRFGCTEQDIILYGQSLGSGPTLHLASKHTVRGIILHSALMSGLRVIRDVDKTSWYDIFPNVDTIRKATSPIFVIHGTMDEEIPIRHGYGLVEAAPVRYDPWFVEGAGHNNIEVHWRREYVAKVKEFLDFLDSRYQTVMP